MKRYVALFENNGKGGYGVVFPDLPGLISAGDDFDNALRMAHEGLDFHISGLQEDGLAVPSPRTLEQIKREWEYWAEWEKEYDFIVGYVSYIPNRDSLRRINVTLPKRLILEIDTVARNRSAFLASAAERMLHG
jgi:predicted RNase H-like HicB family nuclease